MNGIKASTSLQAAQDVEMRLLQILKERDDLVLSYHNSLKELSKLTARINDENHLLRQQLNVTDMSNGDIFLALEDEVRHSSVKMTTLTNPQPPRSICCPYLDFLLDM